MERSNLYSFYVSFVAWKQKWQFSLYGELRLGGTLPRWEKKQNQPLKNLEVGMCTHEPSVHVCPVGVGGKNAHVSDLGQEYLTQHF